jgi:iron-sulfur cluster repair protein YtfE (RIC family)
MIEIKDLLHELTVTAVRAKYEPTVSNEVISICNRAANIIKYQEAAIKELIDYIIDIENYHEERLEQLQSLTNISFSAEE